MRASGESRRGFLESMGLAGAGAILAGSTESARGFLANNTITVGCLGTGGRCRTLMKSLGNLPGVRMVAVADVWDSALAEGRKLADPQAFSTKHYREVLDRKDVDAVLIGSPDHWHVPMTIDACSAGKDVYVEKPVTHEPAEGERLIEAQDRHKRVVQVGQQQRSMPHIVRASELIRSGKIGKVFKLALSWNRNTGDRFARTSQKVDPNQVAWKDFLGSARDQPFDEYRFRNWRWFWDFGGGILTDLMVHWIDVGQWILGLDRPEKATTFGVEFAGKGVWETPDTIQCLLSYPGGVQAHFEGTFSNARNAARIEFLGTEGSIWIDRGGYIIYSERGKGEVESLILGSDPRRGLDFYDKPDGETLHLADWLGAIRSRNKPSCPAEAGVASAAAAHLGNQAFREDRVARWRQP
ncbi:Gfo/Idh/MocA family protein [Tundrisphaera lichenicola]|uniref:Gfo/Idh/MocA family protein n=1 Tax=Tundrisphaera lichenicola TaxID=2029860 RepID=UPI003EBB6781